MVQNHYIRLPLLCLTPPTEGFPETISVKFYLAVNRRPSYQMA